MKKLSSILVLMLIALMLFVSCNNSTPTKESGNSDEVKEASSAEKELFNTFLVASINAIKAEINGTDVPNLELDSDTSATFTGANFEGIVLYGTASMGEILKLNLTDGTELHGVAHTMECEGTRGEDGKITVTKLILDGKKLKYSGPISLQ